MISKFTLIQKFRNKIRIKGSLDIKISENIKFIGCTLRSDGNNNSLIIEDNSVLRNVNIEIKGDNCSIYIGKNCILGDECYISAKDGCKLQILDDCMLSRNIKIMTSDGHPIYKDGIQINKAKNIKINAKVWIADNVTILKGVEIGSNSVIGINSTLTKSVLSNSISVGNPAKTVKEGISWEDSV